MVLYNVKWPHPTHKLHIKCSNVPNTSGKDNVQKATYLPHLKQSKCDIDYDTAHGVLLMQKKKKTVLTYKQNNNTCSGAMTPGQLGPTRRDLDCFNRSCFTFTISCCGTPSVIHTISGISASIASIIAFPAPGGGT
jgi:hypothetical protein